MVTTGPGDPERRTKEKKFFFQRSSAAAVRSHTDVRRWLDRDWRTVIIMSKWWGKVQKALPKLSSLKKTASKNVSFVQKEYGGVTKDKVDEIKKSMTPQKGKDLKTRARERAEDSTSRLGKQVAENARALPLKAAEVGHLEMRCVCARNEI